MAPVHKPVPTGCNAQSAVSIPASPPGRRASSACSAPSSPPGYRLHQTGCGPPTVPRADTLRLSLRLPVALPRPRLAPARCIGPPPLQRRRRACAGVWRGGWCPSGGAPAARSTWWTPARTAARARARRRTLIPAADGTLRTDDSRPLIAAEAGERVRIVRVSHGIGHNDAPALAYLGERGLIPGRDLVVKEVRALDGVVAVEDEDGASHSLGTPLARSIFVRERPAAKD